MEEYSSNSENKVYYEFDKEQQVLIKCTPGESPEIISKCNYCWRDLGPEEEIYARAIFMGEGCWEKLEHISESEAERILAEWEAESENMTDFVLKGNIGYSKNKDELITVADGYLVCLNGKSAGVYTELPEAFAALPLIDYGDSLIIPGMVDLHVHAPEITADDLVENSALWSLLSIHDIYEDFAKAISNSATTRAVVYANPETVAADLLLGAMEDAGLVACVELEGTDYVEMDYSDDADAEKKILLVHFDGITDKDLQFMQEKDAFVAHCLAFDKKKLFFGFDAIRKYIDCGIRVGFGSENAEKCDHSIFLAMHNAISFSEMYWKNLVYYKGMASGPAPITFSEAFYMATKGGGELFGRVGSFEAGYELDVVVIDDSNPWYMPQTLEQRIECAVNVQLDEDRIVAKYVRGEQIVLGER